MQDKIANLLFRSDYGQDRDLADYRPEIQEMYRKEAEEILSFIDAQRCVWTLKNGQFTTSCGEIMPQHDGSGGWEIDDMPPYCWHCGRRIEVKDEQGNLRDQINRILFHVLSNEERADKIVELIAPMIKKAEMWTAFSNEFKDTCPICKANLIFPRNSYCYCEECGWPDEVRLSEEDEKLKEKARLWDNAKEITKEWCYACGDTSACKDCVIEVIELKPLNDAIRILHNRYIKGDPKRLASLARERKTALTEKEPK